MEQLIEKLNRMEDKIERILIQTTKTNGRVDNLEEKTDKHEDQLNDLSAVKSETKGRDKVIWIIMAAIGTVAMLVIGHYL